MFNKEKLEFHKVLTQITKYCYTQRGKEIVNALEPMSVETTILYEGKSVSEAKDLINERGYPPISALNDILKDLHLTKVDGAVLTSKAVFNIFELTICSTNLKQYLKNNRDIAPVVGELGNFLFEDKLFERYISTIFDPSGEIKDNAVLTSWETELQDQTKYLGLNIAISPISKLQTDTHKEKALISIHGADKAGIVAKVSKFLYDQNINVSNLETQLIHEPKPLYIMQIEIECAADHLKKINSDLEKLGKSLDVSIKIQSIREAVI